MPKNKGKGGKNRRRGKNEHEKDKRELIIKEPGQEYAQVLRMLGNGRLEAYCFDKIQRLCHIRGKLRKKVWINNNDVILLGLREFQNDKADKMEEIPDNINVIDATTDGAQTKTTSDIIFDEKPEDDVDDEDVLQQSLDDYIGHGNIPSDDDSDESDESEDEDEEFNFIGKNYEEPSCEKRNRGGKRTEMIDIDI
ncbi:hypothetical protein SNEBB_010939 [Seison nebaliae]|nr:hypothetical protein SNEBB_010939 [Seison nebaliae]